MKPKEAGNTAGSEKQSLKLDNGGSSLGSGTSLVALGKNYLMFLNL